MSAPDNQNRKPPLVCSDGLGRWNGEPETEMKPNSDVLVRFPRYFRESDDQFDVEKCHMSCKYQTANKSHLGNGLWVVYAPRPNEKADLPTPGK